MFFPEGRSLGQRTIPVESQSKDAQFGKFRENLRWKIGGITFATLHMIGSNDNYGRTPEMDAEQTRAQSREHRLDARCLCGGQSGRRPRCRADGAGQPGI